MNQEPQDTNTQNNDTGNAPVDKPVATGLDSLPPEMPSSDMPSADGSSMPPMQPQANNSRKLWMILAAVVVVAAGAALVWWLLVGRTTPKKQASVTTPVVVDNTKAALTIAVHWEEDQQINGIKNADGTLKSKGLKQYLDEYTALHPNITFKIQQIQYDQYANQLQALSDSGAPPDIYQIYAPWGASYVRKGVLAEPPENIKQDVQANYISTAGPTIEGKLWGIPTEIDNYALLYNKDLFKQAGIVDAQGNPRAPKTWQDVLDDAKKLTKHDSKGTITQYGFATLYNNDWQSVDPFLSLLFSNGGQYLSNDLKTAAFDTPAGVTALTDQVQLFKDGSTDSASNFYDFGKGKVGIVIAPPWVKANFASDFGSNFSSTVGVTSFPTIKTSNSLQYSWFTGVMKGSAHQKQAWDFLAWFTEEKQASGTTRYGDLLAETIGAIPARTVDFNSHKDVLGDFYTGVYVNQMKNSKAEPNVLQASDLKAALMSEIQSAWDGKKTPQQSLDSAAASINTILKQNYK